MLHTYLSKNYLWTIQTLTLQNNKLNEKQKQWMCKNKTANKKIIKQQYLQHFKPQSVNVNTTIINNYLVTQFLIHGTRLDAFVCFLI